MTRAAIAVAAFVAAVSACVVLALPAQALNTRVSITDFAWSNPKPEIDLGESVTWDWLGPDLQHSVTGSSPNAKQWDSNPETSIPLQKAGHSYSVKFDEPGEYFFICKVHAFVRGSVVVSNNPGDPDSDPGPQPPINYDIEPPFVDEIRHFPTVYGPKGKGGPLEFAVSERGRADADYYQLVKRGKRTVKRFAGYSEWPTFIGYNKVRFGARGATFKARPGKYEALFRVTDEDHNTTDPITMRFEIKAPPNKKRARAKKLKAQRQKAKQKAKKAKQKAKKKAKKQKQKRG